MITKADTPPGEDRWTSGPGELVIKRPTSRVVVFVESGYLEAGFAPLITDAMTRALGAANKPYFFVDADKLESYDPPIRVQATKWLEAHREGIVAQHMLVRSRIAKMGLSVASLMLGGVIVGHHERRTFEKALAEAIAATRVRDASTPATS